ncbi:hypothetical protein IU486_07720 [Streptomyces gardneri]|uniref:hypothetical protein n=1 Tax=Nocardia sputi TaxID=2943705 RepID=UPI0018936E52|nr:hypothetical protein [Nocardia sputi]MBF6164661.1 hypothetical protein [Streptomyces gardneri]
MSFFGISWGDVGKFALTTGATFVGGAVGSVLLPGVGTAAGAALAAGLTEAAITGAEGGSFGEAMTNGAQTGAFALLGGGIGGAIRGGFATMGGQNLARRALSGAVNPSIRNPANRMAFGDAWNARGASLNAARGWLGGASVGAGIAGGQHKAAPPATMPAIGGAVGTLPTKVLNELTQFTR